MKYLVALVLVFIATIAEAACPGGSTCENYNGTIPYTTTNPTGTASRTPADRASDAGVNIKDFGAGSGASAAVNTVAIQKAIDACSIKAGCRRIACPDDTYPTSLPIYLDVVDNLRGKTTFVTTNNSVTTNTSTTVTLVAPNRTDGLYQGMRVTGTNIPANTRIASVVGTTQLTLTAAATGSASNVVLSFDGTWDSGTTYAVNDIVKYSGGVTDGVTAANIPWKAIQGSNTNHSPSLPAAGLTPNAWWSPTAAYTVWDTNWGPAFTGTDGLDSGAHLAGCTISPTFNNSAVIWTVGNGPMIKGVTIEGPDLGSAVTYHCHQPYGGFPGGDATHTGLTGVGIAIASNGTRTKIQNVRVHNTYYGVLTAANSNGNLADSNSIEKSEMQNNCFSVAYGANQNFANDILESNLGGAFGVYATQGTPVNIYAGNHSTLGIGGSEEALNNTFTLSGSSATVVGSVITLTTTITNPDTYLLDATRCATAAPDFAVTSGSIGPGSIGCVYNVFTINTTHYGIVPLIMTSISCTSTCSTTFVVPTVWFMPWASTLPPDLNTEIGAPVGNALYAAEMATTYWGCGIHVTGPHLENFGFPTKMIKSDCSFGGQAPNTLDSVYANYQMSLQQRVNDAFPLFAAQMVFPFIELGGTALNVRAMVTEPGGNPNDRVLIDFPAGGGTLSWQNKAFYLHTRGTNGAGVSGFTQGYSGIGGPGFGTGEFDASASASAFTSFAGGAHVGTFADQFRSLGWGKSPFWGYRPAPYSSPCLTPAQITTLSSAPPSITNTGASFSGTISAGVLTVSSVTGTIAAGTYIYGAGVPDVIITGGSGTTWTINDSTTVIGSPVPMSTRTFAVSYPLMWGGQQYKACDWNSPAHNTVVSSHRFYSYGQDLTTSNVPNLSATYHNKGFNLYGNAELMQLLFPGLGIRLTCNSHTNIRFIISEVYPTLGYARIINGEQDGTPFNYDFGTADCTFTTIGQEPYVISTF